jgi:deoxyribonuclease V
VICVDVDYRTDRVVAAAVGFHTWTDDVAAFERTRTSFAPPAEYEPGSFYRRELPYLLGVLDDVPAPITTVVIDGYVWLDAGHKGLGAHLHEVHPARPIVVGVAKRPWRGGRAGVSVVRGDAKAPLWITAIGMDLDEAARGVAAMHGPYRMPTLLKRVDRLARDT